MPSETDKKMGYLQRDEVKTMTKDLARLREEEARKERARISQIKAGEALEEERERQKQAQEEAAAREKGIEEAEKKQEELARLRREREERLASAEAMTAEEKENKEKLFKEKLMETQKKEEEERKKFLERVENQVTGKPPQPSPPPSPLPLSPQISEFLVRKPSLFEKIWIRAILSLLIFSLLALLVSFWYWYLAVRPEKVLPPKEEVIISPEELLAGMSLEERVGQLFIIGFEAQGLTPELKSIFEELSPGGVILFSKNIADENQIKKLINDLQGLSSLPLFVAVDQEGGVVNRIPFLNERTSQAKIGDEAQALQVGLARGKELKALGFNLNLAPVLDQLNPGDFLYQRGFQRNAEVIGKLGKAMVEGQKEAGILTAIKHFPGYTGITFNPEEAPARLFRVPEVSQFKKAMEARPEFVMTSNVIVTELDPIRRFMFSEPDIKFLRDSLPGDYLIITDDLSQNVLLQKFSLEDILTTPINAGVDILLFSDYRESPEKAIKAFLGAVRDNKVSKEIIDQTVLKIIKLKQGLR